MEPLDVPFSVNFHVFLGYSGVQGDEQSNSLNCKWHLDPIQRGWWKRKEAVRYNNTQQQLKWALLVKGNCIATGVCTQWVQTQRDHKKDLQKLQVSSKLGENWNKQYKTFRAFPLHWIHGDEDVLLPSERFGDECTLPYHLISEILTLKPCVSSNAKGLCRKLQLEVKALQQPLWSQSP